MSDPLTPDDAEDPLVEKLAYGIEMEDKTMDEVRTTFVVDWMDEYKFVLEELGESGRFRSRTMCEMVIVREARRKYEEIIGKTYSSWGMLLRRLGGCIDRESEIYDVYKTNMEGANSALSKINLSQTCDKGEYVHSAAKKDVNRLRQVGSVEDTHPTHKIHVGLCAVVKDNTDLFGQNLVSDAERVIENVSNQHSSLRRSAVMYAVQSGRMLREARNEGSLHEKEFEKRLEGYKSDDKISDELVESIRMGYNDDDKVLGREMGN